MGQLRAIGRGAIILGLAIIAALLSCVNMPVSSNASGKQVDHWILALNSSPYLATNEHPLNAPGPATVPQLMTFYGWPDNDPPGNAIAYPHSQFPSAIHESAGGSHGHRQTRKAVGQLGSDDYYWTGYWTARLSVACESCVQLAGNRVHFVWQT